MSLDFQSSILSHALSSAGDLTSQASALLATATGALQDTLTFENPDQWQYLIRPQALTYEPRSEVEGLPPVPQQEIPPPPSFGNTARAAPGWSVPPPERFPDPRMLPREPFQSPEPNNEPLEPDARVITNPVFGGLPQAPNDFTPGFTLDLLDIRELQAGLTIDLPSISLDPLTVTPPDFTRAEADSDAAESLLYGGYSEIPGVDALTAEADLFQKQVMCFLQEDYLKWPATMLSDPHQAVNPLKADRIGQMAEERLSGIDLHRSRDLTDLAERSGWSLPAPVRLALERRAAQLARADDGERRDQTAARALEQSRVMYAFTVELYTRFREMLEGLRAQEVSAVLDAHAAAVTYARSKIEALAKLFEVKNFRSYDFNWQYAEGLLKVFEQEQKAEKLRYDAVQQQIAVEEQIQSLDQQKVAQYQIEADARRVRLGLIETQIAAVRGEIDLKAQTVEVFNTRLQLFAAKVNADEARLQAMLADIEGNDLEAQRQLAFIKQYDIEVRMYEERINSEMNVGERQRGANDATMQAFTGVAKAAMIPVEYSLLEAQNQLFTHQVNADNFQQDAELALKIQKMDLDFMNEKRRVRRELLRLVQELSTDATETELGRKQAIAQTTARGAAVLASMGEGAMSAATMVGGGILEEYS